jgi:vitamin B12 transporter
VQDPKDRSTGLLLARRARDFGTLHARTQIAGWEFGAGIQASGRRYDDAANQVPLGGYALLDLDAALRLTNDLKLQINLDNAFNRVYQTASGYAQAPRTLMVGLRYTPTF